LTISTRAQFARVSELLQDRPCAVRRAVIGHNQFPAERLIHAGEQRADLDAVGASHDRLAKIDGIFDAVNATPTQPLQEVRPPASDEEVR
jgi:hypothetical protein